MLGRPAPGNRIQMLTGFMSGWIGTVAPEDTWWSSEEFCVQFDHDRPGLLHRVLLRHNLFVLESNADRPPWLPPLSTNDLALMDEVVVRFCAALFQKNKWSWRDEKLYVLIEMSWQRRLPVQGKEVWEMCAAHGIPQHHKSDFISTFDFGIGLLVYTHGRPPIKRRRVQAMSIWRYEPLRRDRENSREENGVVEDIFDTDDNAATPRS